MCVCMCVWKGRGCMCVCVFYKRLKSKLFKSKLNERNLYSYRLGGGGKKKVKEVQPLPPKSCRRHLTASESEQAAGTV